MVNITKSQPAPACLALEKLKVSGDYKCGDVLERLKKDFYNKCYICENKGVSSINVEHFIAHKGNKDLKFAWENLFWSCSHCNNVKLHLYDNILNCTDPTHLVEDFIKYEMRPYPKEKVKITALKNEATVHKTVELLHKVYNGHTKLKVIESANIRAKLLNEIRDFQSWLVEYFEDGINEADKEYAKRKIERHLNISSCFAAFKRWIVKDNVGLKTEFSYLLKN